MRSDIIFLVFAALFCMSIVTVAGFMLIGQINTHIEATMVPQKSWHKKISQVPTQGSPDLDPQEDQSPP